MPRGQGGVEKSRNWRPSSYNLPVMSDAVSQNHVKSGTYTRQTRRPHGGRGALVTLGLRILATAAQVAVLIAEISNVRGNSSETAVSDKVVIVNSPTNTSGFSTYTTQVAVTPTEI
jgi:hypothetical protein